MNLKDLAIVDILQNDANLSYAEIGQKVELSITAVKERVKKLIQNNVLKDKVYIPNPIALGHHICAFIQVLMPYPEQEDSFTEAINQIEEVQECHFITGEYSYLLKVRVKTTYELERLLAQKIKAIEGVTRTNTIISLTTSKESLQLKVS